MVKYDELKQPPINQNGEGGSWMGNILTGKNLGLLPANSNPEQGMEDEGRQATGTIKYFNAQKRFGFVVEDSGGGGGGGGGGGAKKKDFFFHESKVPDGLQVQTGMRITFETATDGKGRPSAIILGVVNDTGTGKTDGPQLPSTTMNANNYENNEVELPCFSMSQPFVALLLNGIKTVETRNNPMFADLEPGTKVLLHCGFKDWNDQEAPKHELQKAGYSAEEIRNLSALPKDFTRGSIVGILTVGETWKSTQYERDGEDLQRKVIASANDMGQYCTPIQGAQWLNQAAKARGNAGIYSANVPKKCLPT